MYELISKPGRSWYAYLPPDEAGHISIVQINIERTQYCTLRATPFYWVSQGTGHVGMWPGELSDEWIEYIPAPVQQLSMKHDSDCICSRCCGFFSNGHK